MGLKDSYIIFDNQWGTYYAGQTVSGRVEINLDSVKKIRGIKICFNGEANVHWIVHESRTNHEGKSETETVHLSGSEIYFNMDYYLLGGQGTSTIELPTGQHVYPFTCVLPPTLPSSFEGDFGEIRYTVTVTLDRPWKFDQKIKAAFTVLSPVDLNFNPSLKAPVSVNFEKYFCCCWCKSGPLTCIVSLPYTGYVPGQTIPVVAEVDNISNVQLVGVEFSFRKTVAYYSRLPRRETKRETIVLEKIRIGPVAAHGSRTIRQPVVIPSLPPSNLTNCCLIDLDYELYIEVIVEGMHSNLTGKIPLTIGTVPLNMPQQQMIADSVAVNMDGGPTIGWANNSSNYPPPPSYEESQFGTKSIQDANDQHTRFSGNNEKYSPRYPVYNFTPTAPPE